MGLYCSNGCPCDSSIQTIDAYKSKKGGEQLMDKMILGIFVNRDDAEEAIVQLEEQGYNPKDISFIMQDREQAKEMAESTGSSVASGAVGGATTGGLIGGLAGLLVGIGAITVPGLGALFIAGPVATALGLTGAAATTVSGAVTGALAGGFLGALIGLGIPEEDARVYEDRIRAGGILVIVPAILDNVDQVKRLLEDCNADQIRSITAPQYESIDRRSFVKDDYSSAIGYGAMGIKGGSSEDTQATTRRGKRRRSR